MRAADKRGSRALLRTRPVLRTAVTANTHCVLVFGSGFDTEVNVPAGAPVARVAPRATVVKLAAAAVPAGSAAHRPTT